MDTPEEVAAWVADHERQHGNGIAGLRAALARGIIAGRSATIARAWLDEHENGERRQLEQQQLELARLNTNASELAAKAAADSARHAGVSARWAKVAAGIAVLAVLVSAWPLVQPLLDHPAKPIAAPAPDASTKH